ncbi:hypothetical protein [Qaidamihabitans albus]|uniref:hypothetical protein n=1 Tax=Qaidamihabitans albus TaxID=2795733 RepID=UPI0018F1280A|nr:hypothetical protein [Qaidamihabitans albus]
MDARSRRLLARARARGTEAVPVLILAPTSMAAAVTALGGRVDSEDERTGYLRAELPVAAVDELAARRDVESVQVLEDVIRDDPAP